MYEILSDEAFVASNDVPFDIDNIVPDFRALARNLDIICKPTMSPLSPEITDTIERCIFASLGWNQQFGTVVLSRGLAKSIGNIFQVLIVYNVIFEQHNTKVMINSIRLLVC